jgi:hypothetical protein
MLDITNTENTVDTRKSSSGNGNLLNEIRHIIPIMQVGFYW